MAKTVTVNLYLEFQVEDLEGKDLKTLVLETARTSENLEVTQIYVDDNVVWEA